MNRRAASAFASVVLALSLGAGVAACGDDDEGGGADTMATTAPAPATQPPTATTETPASKPDPRLQRKPRVVVPKGDAPSKLETQDIIRGKGKVARSGDNVTVQYVGVLFDGGKEFDASWNRGEPFEFQLGAGMVIPGWDQGVAGMREGGRRRLVIPPDLAYGPQGQPPTIPPNATLVFVVDLVRVG